LENKPRWKNLLKYFFHGISFSFLLLVLSLFYAAVFAQQILLGLFLLFVAFIFGLFGLLFSIAIADSSEENQFFIVGRRFNGFFLIFGDFNSVLTENIWGITLETKPMSLIGHGSVLFFALFAAGVPAIIISLLAPGLATSIALFIIYAFIDGFVSKKIASDWEDYCEEEKEEPGDILKVFPPRIH